MIYNHVNDDSIDELMHYGVKGMRWGVRRNVRLLANRKRNEAVRAAKKEYRRKNISKSEYKTRKKAANRGINEYKKSIKTEFKNAKNSAERKALRRKIAQDTLNKVPHSRLKKGIDFVNKALTVGYVVPSAVTAGGLAIAGSPLAGVGLTGVAIGTLGNLGRQYLVSKGLDRLT